MRTRPIPTAVSLTAYAALLLFVQCARAQIVSDSTTNTLNNVTNTITGTVTVGTNGSFTTLLLTNNALLTNTLDGVIGRNDGASSNAVLLHGLNSRWQLARDLYVGSNGAANSLLIAGGSRVFNRFGYVGFNSSASNNAVVVTGTGSLWSNQSVIYVGYDGSRNQLVVSNGGLAAAINSTLGYSPGSSNNAALVTGAGSLWTNSSSLYVGGHGGGNQLVISDGGVVANSFGALGVSAPTANDNRAIITGSGSRWHNSFSLYIGYLGSGNQLIVSNGGVVSVVNDYAYLGHNPGANSNRAWVTGAGSLWTNNWDLYVGRSGNENHLVVRDGGVVANRNGLIGENSTASNNVVLVTDPSSRWVSGDTLHVGYGSSGNRLVVSNGAVVSSRESSLAYNLGASNNMALVTGAGSLWTNRDYLYIGHSGSGNQLLVSNGGAAIGDYGFLGFDSNADHNLAVVTGAGSLWSNRSALYVGNYGSENLFVLQDGAQAAGSNGVIGGQMQATNNVGLVTDAGSRWSASGNFLVGRYGSGNYLIVSNGGLVASGTGSIGPHFSASNNVALVTGQGSLWNNTGDLMVGQWGSGNRLVVSNGGAVHATNVFVGSTAISINNRLVVDGGALHVTSAGSAGALDIRRGTNVLQSGQIVADWLVMTNSAGFFDFHGGTLSLQFATVNNGLPFIVGDGTRSALLEFVGSGTRAFSSTLVISSNATVSFGAGTLQSAAITNLSRQFFTVGDGVGVAVLDLASNGGYSFASGLVIATNGQLIGNGTIVGPVTNRGNIRPGTNFAGGFTIDGNLHLTGSSLMTFELGGLLPIGQHDQVTVDSFIELAGNLSLSLRNGFLPEADDTFTLLRFDSYSGAFANAPADGRVSLANNLASYSVSYSSTNLVISEITYTDTDGDGQGDLQEQAAGTNPADSKSAMRVVSLTRVGDGPVSVRFTASSGRNYRIEYSDDLVTWNSILSPTLTSHQDGTRTWLDDGSLTGGLNPSTQRYYRIGLQ